MRKSKKELRELVMGAHLGDCLFISGIALTTGAIDLLRGYIRRGVLIPSLDYYHYGEPDKILSGEVILQQNEYTVCK